MLRMEWSLVRKCLAQKYLGSRRKVIVSPSRFDDNPLHYPNNSEHIPLRGNLTYIITTSRMISGDVLK
jgi:hypothetical protein